MIEIRHGEAADVDWMLGQLRKFAQFFGSKRSLFGDEAHARATLGGMIQDHLVLVAAADGSERLGFIAGLITPHMYNPEIRVLCETFWWVAEEHRRSRAGLLLLNAFLAWGKAHADWITFSLEQNSPMRAESLEKRGLHLHERSFLMEVG